MKKPRRGNIAERPRRKVSAAIAAGALGAGLLLTGCSTSTPTPDASTVTVSPTPVFADGSMDQFISIAKKKTEPSPPPNPTVSNGSTVTATPTPTVTAPAVAAEVGNTVFSVPQAWTPATVPGGDKAFNVTTAPKQRTVSFNTVSTVENTIDEEFLRKISSGITSDPQKNITDVFTAPISASEGLILFTRNGEAYYNWVVSNLSGTYLISLGPSYNDGKNGTVSSPPAAGSSISATPASSTAVEQVQQVVDTWLGG